MKATHAALATVLSACLSVPVAAQTSAAGSPQDCLKAARDFTTRRTKELAPLTAETARKITAERLEMIRACAAQFDVEKATAADIAALVDLYIEAQQRELADKALTRGLSLDLALPQRADLLASAVRLLLRQPKSDARNAKAESYVDILDAMPAEMLDRKLAAHVALNNYYRADDIDAGIIKHSTWLIEQGRTLDPALHRTAGPALVSAYINLAEALAGQGENDRALDLLRRAPVELPDVPSAATRTQDVLARYMLVGTPARAIEAPWWLNREATGPLDLKGAVTLIQFTAHWCGPCKESYPGMLRLLERFKDRSFRELFITRPYGYFETEQNLTPEQEIERDRQYYARYGFTIPIAIGPPTSVMVDGRRTPQEEPNEKAFLVGGIPQINLIDANGRIRLIMIGYDDANEARLAGFIEKLLAEK